MLFRIAKENQERAARAFTVEREKHNFGYKKSGILYPKSNRIMHYYEIDVIDADRIVCTVRHKNTDCIVALVWLSGYTPESIEVDQAELYRNCSNYPYRREYNEKYLKKYDQIACVVHGAIINGLLFDAESDKEPEAAQDTTCTETEPQRATETEQKTTNMETFKKAYSAAYSHLYDHAHTPAAQAKTRIYSALFDEQWEQIKDAAKAFCQITGDLITSDRECAAFMIALETVGAPTDGKTATDGETTTTPETDAQRATESAENTIRTGARLYSHPHRHMVTVEGLQGELVMVVYRGRLYLVSRGDLYTDETETTPAILPAEPEEAAQPAAVTPMENDTTNATKTTQQGTESATATTGRECTQQAAQDAQNAHRATEAHRPIQRHTAPHKRPYRATQRAAKSIMRHSPTTATGRRPAEKSHFLAGMGSAKILGQGNHPPPILA